MYPYRDRLASCAACPASRPSTERASRWSGALDLLGWGSSRRARCPDAPPPSGSCSQSIPRQDSSASRYAWARLTSTEPLLLRALPSRTAGCSKLRSPLRLPSACPGARSSATSALACAPIPDASVSMASLPVPDDPKVRPRSQLLLPVQALRRMACASPRGTPSSPENTSTSAGPAPRPDPQIGSLRRPLRPLKAKACRLRHALPRSYPRGAHA